MSNNTGMRGTPVYMAPEILRSEAYGSAADVYSFAVVAWEVFACMKPHPRLSVVDLINKVGNGDLRPGPMPADMPVVVQEIILQCWLKDSKARPKMMAVVKQLEALIGK